MPYTTEKEKANIEEMAVELFNEFPLSMQIYLIGMLQGMKGADKDVWKDNRLLQMKF